MSYFCTTAWRHNALLFFLLAAALATGFSIDIEKSISSQLSLALGVFLYVLTVLLVRKKETLKFFLTISPLFFLWSIVSAAPEIALTRLDIPLRYLRQVGSSWLVVPNDALLLSIAAPLLFGAAWTGGKLLRCTLVFYVLFALAIGINLQSRQAVVFLLLGMVSMVGMMRPRLTVFAILAGCVFGVVLDGLSGWVLARKLLLLFPRTYVWHSAWVMFIDRPWVGQGPGLFRDMYFIFLSKAGYVLGELSDRRTMPWAHSLYLEQLAERGVLGFIALLFLLARTAQLTIRSWRYSSSEETRAMSAGVTSALMIFALAGIAETSFSRMWVVVSMLLLAALAMALSRLSSEKFTQQESH